MRTLYQTNAFRTVEARWQDAGNGRVIVYFMLTEYPKRIEEIATKAPGT